MRISMQVALKRGGLQSKGAGVAGMNPGFVIYAVAGLPSPWPFFGWSVLAFLLGICISSFFYIYR